MVTFTRRSAGYAAATDTLTPTTSTITGNAFARRGNPQRYRELGLTLATAVTLFFTPTDYPLAVGSFVQAGDTVDWAGVRYTVRDVDAFAPDGYVVFAYIVVSR